MFAIESCEIQSVVVQEIEQLDKISNLLNETIFANEDSQKGKQEERIKKDIMKALDDTADNVSLTELPKVTQKRLIVYRKLKPRLKH